ncbi:hypothetical protein QEZ48_12375 [Aquamicrobium lusatiense]|uniref:Uncharacterized protein n=1 Tax=Aquamicrobium lusatiense TaxID=89772 RepID=A0A7W9RZ26_9HYPH|nr:MULTISPECIES: hypothetical protein [Aquamicrobium]MBB6011141.1 hypothetical protein [Aquamicrobium lusatiense]MDH4991619.1 hypothetical protein [Aquamicrobium lusatiense]
MRGLTMALLARGLFSRETPAPAGRMIASLLSTKTTAKKTTATTV